ncbi:hypothetical protein CPT_Slocum_130 [Serratia phage Slocum]|nr:hypothetical protein CPT_Slocum_130 [Serratia phage Slocum]URC22581.1 hypothetical protein KAMAJI_01530 [Serratia phage vB_SmaM-Kamaji]
MPIYNKEPDFIPLRKRAQPLRKVRKANIQEPDTRNPPEPEWRLRYEDEEMAERERLAQEEIERKKLCTAPAYNKGGYQYIASKEMAEDAGRKK